MLASLAAPVHRWVVLYRVPVKAFKGPYKEMPGNPASSKQFEQSPFFLISDALQCLVTPSLVLIGPCPSQTP